jgi:ankyrin repeat protein
LCDINGQSSLYIASEEWKGDVVKCLLSSGADINLCDRNGKSPLFAASEKEKLMLLNAYLVPMQISICVILMDNHHCI